jgi:pimeloyl-ACP methyl ester carboxylesterase
MISTVASADGIALHYEVYGTGAPAIVFVHGWSCDLSHWHDQRDHFAERYQVVAIDLAGHGRSERGRPVYTMQSFGTDVVAVVDHLGLTEMVLVGHSMGGDVIVEAALRLPHRVTGLVWVDTYRSLGTDPDHQAAAAFVARFEADFPKAVREVFPRMFGGNADPALVDQVVSQLAAAPVDVALDAMRHALAYEAVVPAALLALTVPVTAINPDYRPTDVESLARHGVTTRIVAGAGHWLMRENPAAFNRQLDEAIADLTRAVRPAAAPTADKRY